MSLLQELKDASVEARKCKSVLSSFMITLYSESAMVGKTKGNRESTDEEVLSVIRKFKAGAEEVLGILQSKTERDTVAISRALSELTILNSYLPVLYSEEELSEIIQTIINNGATNIGQIMGALKAQHSGKYDGALASKIIKELL